MFVIVVRSQFRFSVTVTGCDFSDGLFKYTFFSNDFSKFVHYFRFGEDILCRLIRVLLVIWLAFPNKYLYFDHPVYVFIVILWVFGCSKSDCDRDLEREKMSTVNDIVLITPIFIALSSFRSQTNMKNDPWSLSELHENIKSKPLLWSSSDHCMPALLTSKRCVSYLQRENDRIVWVFWEWKEILLELIFPNYILQMPCLVGFRLV